MCWWAADSKPLTPADRLGIASPQTMRDRHLDLLLFSTFRARPCLRGNEFKIRAVGSACKQDFVHLQTIPTPLSTNRTPPCTMPLLHPVYPSAGRSPSHGSIKSRVYFCAERATKLQPINLHCSLSATHEGGCLREEAGDSPFSSQSPCDIARSCLCSFRTSRPVSSSSNEQTLAFRRNLALSPHAPANPRTVSSPFVFFLRRAVTDIPTPRRSHHGGTARPCHAKNIKGS